MGIIITFGTLFLLLITSFIVVFVLIHRHQSRMNIIEKEELKNAFQQEMLKAQLEMKEKTLQFIAQEIHDGVGQILSLAKLNLNTIQLEDTNPFKEKISDTKDLLKRAIQDLRHMSKSLNSDFLSNQQLTESIRMELDQIRRTGYYTTNMEVKGDERNIDPEKGLIVFRIVQENFNNIIKHAHANNISVVLNYEPRYLNMTIKDNGTGFKLSSINKNGGKDKGTGIGNMYRRARMVGAEFSINSQLNKGTISTLSLTI